MKLLPHLFNSTCTQPKTTSFWPYCSQNPKTLSFRSIRCDEVHRSSSYCNDTKEPPKCSISIIEDLEDQETMESVIKGLKSDRLFFDPDDTNSILGEVKEVAESNNGYGSKVEKNVTLLSMDSKDPHLDFKKSMEEMVEAHGGVIGWDWLQELFGCYLKVNEKSNHVFIIGAFVELLVSLDLEGLGLQCSSSSFVASSSSPFTFSSSNISTSRCSSSNLPTDDAAADLQDGLVDESEMMMLEV